ncbi:MAG TPA: laccase domain-containing protein, partial [Burkholderiaceae bacterium]|nr:laccase domain-containing protein [Burkholderiaceae bacterium]
MTLERAAAARHPSWLAPDWAIDGIGALMTTRLGGVGAAPFDTLNLRDGLGDDPQAVAHNQRLVASAAGAVPVYLKQVHGAAVVRLTAADARAGAPIHAADAAITTAPGIACAVQVADCLPVLFAAPDARGVG